MSNCKPATDLSLFLQLENYYPKNTVLLNHIGEYYLKNYDNNKAIDYFLKIEEYQQNDIQNLKNIARVYQRKAEFKESVKYYDKLGMADFTDMLEFEEAARAYLNTENYVKAIPFYLEADKRKDSPTHTWHLNNIAWCHIKLNQYTEAAHYLDQVLALSPSDAWALGKIGFCHQKFKDYEKALEFHLKAHQLGSPEPTWCLGCIAWCYFVTGNLDKAEQNLSECIKKKDADESDWMNYAHILLCRNKGKDAVEMYKKSLAMYEDKVKYFEEFEEDFEHISRYGITQSYYQQIKEELMK